MWVAEALEGGMSGLGGGYAHIDGCIIAIAGDEVQSSIFGLLRVLDDIELDVVILFAKSLGILACYMCVAIYDWAAYL
jgi:hypothetical protein